MGQAADHAAEHGCQGRHQVDVMKAGLDHEQPADKGQHNQKALFAVKPLAHGKVGVDHRKSRAQVEQRRRVADVHGGGAPERQEHADDAVDGPQRKIFDVFFQETGRLVMPVDLDDPGGRHADKGGKERLLHGGHAGHQFRAGGHHRAAERGRHHKEYGFC